MASAHLSITKRAPDAVGCWMLNCAWHFDPEIEREESGGEYAIVAIYVTRRPTMKLNFYTTSQLCCASLVHTTAGWMPCPCVPSSMPRRSFLELPGIQNSRLGPDNSNMRLLKGIQTVAFVVAFPGPRHSLPALAQQTDPRPLRLPLDHLQRSQKSGEANAGL